jgi:uncharacterized short protein YbdD (DUF466 family)
VRDILTMTMRTARRVIDETGPATLGIKEWTVRTARLMVGVPDYDTYVQHRRTNHPDQAIMTYEEFFVERQEARYAVSKGRFRGCC